MNRNDSIAILAALFADFGAARPQFVQYHGSPEEWRRGPRRCGARHARGPLPPSKVDHAKECARFAGKTMRHRITGEARIVSSGTEAGDCAVVLLPLTGHLVVRSPRKALAWLQNADEVTAPAGGRC